MVRRRPAPCLAALRATLGLAALGSLTAGEAALAGAPADAPPSVAAAREAVPWPPPRTPVTWTSPTARPGESERIKLLAFNDLHGNLEPPVRPGERPAGGAAVLAAYLEAAARGREQRTLIVHAGDLLGASPPLSRLLLDEPTIDFLNLLAGPGCAYGIATRFFDAAGSRPRPDRCNVVGTLGNHEFDRGALELRRLLKGGNAAAGPFLDRSYRGAKVPYVCANVFERATGRTLLPPYAVVQVGALRVGVIGAVVRDTPSLVQGWAAAGLEFRDEADSINAAARELSAAGVGTIIVLIHQGVVPVMPASSPSAANSPAPPAAGGFVWRGPLAGIVARLDAAVDVVISGHTHRFTNALLPNAVGQPVLVTQAYSYGIAYADIDLDVDRRTHHVVRKSALIVPTWRDAGPGLHPDGHVLALTAAAARWVAPQISRVVGEAAVPITRAVDASGESALGDLVADAERAAGRAEFALVNPGGMRADLDRGPITWGAILTLHPFGNRVLTTALTGATVVRTLEEQWREDPAAIPEILKISGFSYRWDPTRPRGARVVAVCDAAGHALDPKRIYRVAINDFLAAGGDGFEVLKSVPAGTPGPTDAEALAAYIASASGAVEPPPAGRIRRVGRDAGAQCALRALSAAAERGVRGAPGVREVSAARR